MTSILDTVIDIGGLMRCCLDSIDKLAAESPDMMVPEGQRLQCRHTEDPTHSIIYRDGAWRWNRPGDRDEHRNLTDGDA